MTYLGESDQRAVGEMLRGLYDNGCVTAIHVWADGPIVTGVTEAGRDLLATMPSTHTVQRA